MNLGYLHHIAKRDVGVRVFKRRVIRSRIVCSAKMKNDDQKDSYFEDSIYPT